MQQLAQEVVEKAFYLDWTFWAVAVALLALILSQIPPILLLIKRAKLELELFSRIHLTHKIGNPNLESHLVLINSGGRSLRINSIEIKITRDKKDSFVLPGQTYLDQLTDKQDLLLTKFTLKPNQEWIHSIKFLNYFDRETEKAYKAAELTLKDDIDKKLKLNPDAKEPKIADDKNVRPFLDLHEKLFKWKPGDYELEITVSTNRKNYSASKKYRFTLFESESEELYKYNEKYKMGEGVYYNMLDASGINVRITELND